MSRASVWRTVWSAALVLLVAAPVRAQSAVGAGPMTGALADTEPTTGILSWGPVRVAPGITVPEAGHDDNVFDEAVDPKEDWVLRVTPDVSVFSLLRFMKVSAYAGTDLNYYKTYVSEQSAGYNVAARFDFLLSRVRPYIGVADRNQRMRPNGEIDTRADTHESELGGGLAFDLATHSAIYVSAIQLDTEFRDAFEEGVNLETALSRRNRTYSAGVRTELTPLTAMTVSASYAQDLFDDEPLRNSESFAADLTFEFAPQAVLTGQVDVGYQDLNPDDPLVSGYRGLTAGGAVMIPVLEFGRFNLAFHRGVEYSFEESEGYYITTSFNGSYTQRLFGEVDAQLFGERAVFNYGHRAGGTDRDDTTGTARASFGYNLRNRTRIALNYEVSQRRSPELAERNYDRTRIFLSWSYAY